MDKESFSFAQRLFDWQNRHVTPVLLVISLIAVEDSRAVGAVPSWLAVVVFVFGIFALASLIKRNRQ